MYACLCVFVRSPVCVSRRDARTCVSESPAKWVESAHGPITAANRGFYIIATAQRPPAHRLSPTRHHPRPATAPTKSPRASAARSPRYNVGIRAVCTNITARREFARILYGRPRVYVCVCVCVCRSIRVCAVIFINICTCVYVCMSGMAKIKYKKLENVQT